MSRALTRRIVTRMWGASLLDVETYEEVESDLGATWQAFVVVLLASAAAGLGGIANHGAMGILWHALHGVVLWYAWAWVTCLVGTRWLPTPDTSADTGELLRTIGFSSAPGLVRVLGVVPPLAGFVFPLASLWMFVAMVVAVRQALDYRSTWRAIAVCAIGFPVYAVGLMLSILVLGPWPM
jgi:hypothetical protein